MAVDPMVRTGGSPPCFSCLDGTGSDGPEEVPVAVMLVDLAHPLRDGMAAYPGLPAARVWPVLTHEASRGSYAGRAEFCLTEVAFASNTGTYLDSPWHRFPEAPDVGALPLEAVAALPGVVIDGVADGSGAVSLAGSSTPGQAPTPGALAGHAVLVRTGWDAHWGTDAYWRGPHLSSAAVAALVEARPALVGVDFANIDDTADPARPAHTALLGAGVLVVEHMTGLEQLPAQGFRFHCVPLAVHGAASMPVRPYAEVPRSDGG